MKPRTHVIIVDVDSAQDTARNVITVQKGDYAHLILFRFFSNGEPYDLGAEDPDDQITEVPTAVMSIERKSGIGALVEGCTVARNEVTYAFSASAASVVGTWGCQLEVSDAYQNIYTVKFRIVVQPSMFPAAYIRSILGNHDIDEFTSSIQTLKQSLEHFIQTHNLQSKEFYEAIFGEDTFDEDKSASETTQEIVEALVTESELGDRIDEKVDAARTEWTEAIQQMSQQIINSLDVKSAIKLAIKYLMGTALFETKAQAETYNALYTTALEYIDGNWLTGEGGYVPPSPSGWSIDASGDWVIVNSVPLMFINLSGDYITIGGII